MLILNPLIDSINKIIVKIPDLHYHADLKHMLERINTLLKKVAKGKIYNFRIAICYLELLTYHDHKTLGETLRKSKTPLIEDREVYKDIELAGRLSFPIPEAIPKELKKSLLQLHQDLFQLFIKEFHPLIGETLDYAKRVCKKNKNLIIILEKIIALLREVNEDKVMSLREAICYIELLRSKSPFNIKYDLSNLENKEIHDRIKSDSSFPLPEQLPLETNEILFNLHAQLRQLYLTQYCPTADWPYNFNLFQDRKTKEILTPAIRQWQSIYTTPPHHTATENSTFGDIKRSITLQNQSYRDRDNDVIRNAIAEMIHQAVKYDSKHHALLDEWMRCNANQSIPNFITYSFIGPAIDPKRFTKKQDGYFDLHLPHDNGEKIFGNIDITVGAHDRKQDWSISQETGLITATYERSIRCFKVEGPKDSDEEEFYISDLKGGLTQIDQPEDAFISTRPPLLRILTKVELHVESDIVVPKVIKFDIVSYTSQLKLGAALHPTMRAANSLKESSGDEQNASQRSLGLDLRTSR